MKAQELGLRVVLLRNGVVLAKHGGILHRLLTPFRLGLGGRLGSGTQWLPWIHIDDEIRSDPPRHLPRRRSRGP